MSRIIPPFLILVLTIFGCVMAEPSLAQQPSVAPLAAKPVPLPPLRHPPGDIPDTQIFVQYRSPLGFSLKVPEGWARRAMPEGATFSSVYDSVTVQVFVAPAAPSVASARTDEVAALEASPAAVRIGKVASVDLPSGHAVLISFSSSSEPNPVTGKAIRLENDRYLIWKSGRLATLTLSAPFGADNVDQWRLMSRSFQW